MMPSKPQHLGKTQNGDLFSVTSNPMGMDTYAWQARFPETKTPTYSFGHSIDSHNAFIGKIDSSRISLYAAQYGYSYADAERKLAKRDAYYARKSATERQTSSSSGSSGGSWWTRYRTKWVSKD